MNIVMLGHSGVGKTTYMASMYGAVRAGVDKFSLASRYIRDHDDLVSLAQDIRCGTYPPPTAIKSSYDFYLKYDGRSFFPFPWSDYRGGALIERSSSDDTRQLIQDLSKCDGILVFCDSEQAASGRGAGRDIRRMTNLIGEALSRMKRPESALARSSSLAVVSSAETASSNSSVTTKVGSETHSPASSSLANCRSSSSSGSSWRCSLGIVSSHPPTKAQAIVPASRNSARVSADRPSSARIASVCSPSSGAG